MKRAAALLAGFTAWLVWFGGPVWAIFGALICLSAAACAGRWSDYLADIAP